MNTFEEKLLLKIQQEERLKTGPSQATLRFWEIQEQERNPKRVRSVETICAYQTVYDLMAGEQFLQWLEVELDRLPYNIMMLRKGVVQPYPVINRAISELMKEAKNRDTMLKQIQNPFRILNCIRSLLFEMDRSHLTLPIRQSICCNQQWTIAADFDLVWKEEKQSYGQQFSCPRCGQGMVPMGVRLPPVFFTRLSGKKNGNSFKVQKFPKFVNYSIRGYVLYNRQTKHFRTVKPLGKKLTAIFQDKIQLVNKGINEIIFNGKEEIYLLMYSNYSRNQPQFVGQELNNATTLVFTEIMLGGGMDSSPKRKRKRIKKRKAQELNHKMGKPNKIYKNNKML